MRTIVLAVDQSQALDVIGPVEVLDGASKIVAADGRSGYDVQVVTPGGGDVALSNGLRLSAGPLPARRAGGADRGARAAARAAGLAGRRRPG